MPQLRSGDIRFRISNWESEGINRYRVILSSTFRTSSAKMEWLATSSHALVMKVSNEPSSCASFRSCECIYFYVSRDWVNFISNKEKRPTSISKPFVWASEPRAVANGESSIGLPGIAFLSIRFVLLRQYCKKRFMKVGLPVSGWEAAVSVSFSFAWLSQSTRISALTMSALIAYNVAPLYPSVSLRKNDVLSIPNHNLPPVPSWELAQIRSVDLSTCKKSVTIGWILTHSLLWL